MKAEEKAKELVEKYFNDEYIELVFYNEAKQCALICVDRQIKEIKQIIEVFSYSNESRKVINHLRHRIDDLKEVKQEIEKL